MRVINDNHHLWDDDMIVGSVRMIEFIEFFVWLARTQYDGWITIDQYPYREDGRDAVDHDEIQRVLDAHGGVESSRLMRRFLDGSAV
jgi:xylose isomerase